MSVTQVSVTDTYDALLSTTLRNYRDKLVDNIFGEVPLLYWLNEGGRKRSLDGGYQIMIPLLYGENTTTGYFSGYDVLDITPQDGITTAKYDWKSAAVSISINREEERKNSGPHRLVNLLESKTMQAEKSFQWWLSDQLHGRHGSGGKTNTGGETSNTVDSVGGALVDSTGKAFNSLDHLVRSGWGLFDPTGTSAQSHYVGGITCTNTFSTGGSYADWGAVVVGSTVNPWWFNYSNPGFHRLVRGEDGGTLGALLTTELDWAGDIDGNSNQNLISAMRSMYNRLCDGTDHPDLILSGASVYEYYEGALMPLERFLDRKLGDAGFQNLKFKNATMIYDHGIKTALPSATVTAAAPATPLYMLNSKYLEWIVDKDSDFAPTPFRTPENQLARTAQIVLMAQLVCSNRSKQGVISCSTGASYNPA